MAIGMRPNMGVDANGVHPSARLDDWWMPVSLETFVVLSECFHASLIGHKKHGSMTICPAPTLTIEAIEQRFNPREAHQYNHLLFTSPRLSVSPWSEFVRYPWQRISTLGDRHNEIFAWHGTKPEAQQSLEEKGFDMRKVRPNKGLFGDGLYFSPHASKSDMYTRPSPPNDKTAPKSIYIVRLNMGRVYETQVSHRGTRSPPENHDTTRAIGDTGNASLNDEYILYDHRRALIAFKITYTHTDACQCAMCI